MTVRRDDASEAQVRAADPGGSTWLAANAGSGKTRVLTDRVARLLLRGCDPQQILCLTYTKAAATEMQNRLFERLGQWAMQDGRDLRDALMQLGEEGSISDADLDRARTLFATAIETPGGLKIQTIHSFCASLLRRFPLEARVNPMFVEMDDTVSARLQMDVLEAMIEDGDAGPVQAVMDVYSGGDLPGFLSDIVRNQEGLSQVRDRADIANLFRLEPDISADALKARLFLGDEAPLIARVIDAMRPLTKSDAAIADALADITTFDMSALPRLTTALFTDAGTPRARLVAKKVVDALGPDHSELMALVARIEDVQEGLRALSAVARTQTLLQFSVPYLQRYAQAKQVRGLLDFDDLILRTRALLRDQKVSAWVLYRLDGGISHVLVDEAQDTSPAQWDVVRLLTEEFTSGEGAQDAKARSLFVVGDKKQSIYSFQGADPDEFDRMERDFAEKFRTINAPFASRSLEYSFRSSDAILRLVDETFRDQTSAGFIPEQRHHAFHGDKPGRVDLWEVIPKVEKPQEGDWFDPVDRLPDEHHMVALAQKIASEIKTMLHPAAPAMIPAKSDGDTFQMRPVQPGDIMILVQRRSALFHEIIRACKQRDLAIAGADRLRVGGELAVRDLLALFSFLALPEDSLALATVLRSPLFGWSERELYDLSHSRVETHLWQTLRKQDDTHPKTVSILQDLRNQTDFLRPYDLLERVLTRHRGRARLIARLGTEAEDGIDALLAQALAYERSNIPSLTGFLVWAQADDLEIKRQVDSGGNLIRVMTVHGAKGLEAPVVILPDCGMRKLEIKDDILPDGTWRMATKEQPAAMSETVDDMKAAIQRERLRLLYVAMTRAESWLIVAAAGDLAKDGTSWHSLVDAGMDRVGAASHTVGKRYEYGTWTLPVADSGVRETAKTALLEPAFLTPADPPVAATETLSPSKLGGAKALGSERGLDEETAKARGTYLHQILEALIDAPRSDWHQILEKLLPPVELAEDIAQRAQAEAMAVMDQPNLAWIFDKLGLSEVPVSAQVVGRPMFGIIDRLIPDGDVVHVIDFKSNIEVPDSPDQCPDGILRQMGAYVVACEQLYPGKEIRAGILWTSTARYMSVPHKMVRDALDAALYLDVTGGRT